MDAPFFEGWAGVVLAWCFKRPSRSIETLPSRYLVWYGTRRTAPNQVVFNAGEQAEVLLLIVIIDNGHC